MIDNKDGTMTVTYTYDELHAFKEHVEWHIYELDWEIEPNLQSFIDKTLYSKRYDNQNNVTKDSYFIKTKNYIVGEDNSPYNNIPERY